MKASGEQETNQPKAFPINFPFPPLLFSFSSLFSPDRHLTCLNVTSTRFLPVSYAVELDLAGFTFHYHYASSRQSDQSGFWSSCQGMYRLGGLQLAFGLYFEANVQ